jgi:hypothetical protein
MHFPKHLPQSNPEQSLARVGTVNAETTMEMVFAMEMELVVSVSWLLACHSVCFAFGSDRT